MRQSTVKAMVLAAVAAAWLAARASSAEEQRVGGGGELYKRYCAACHGLRGKGDGIVGTFLHPKPTDLTQMAKKAGGVFPFYETMLVIDGRTTIRAHGDPDMPVWGEVFTAEATADLSRQAEVRGKVMMIADYLRSLQE